MYFEMHTDHSPKARIPTLKVTEALTSTTVLWSVCHLLYDLTVTSWNWSRIVEPDG